MVPNNERLRDIKSTAKLFTVVKCDKTQNSEAITESNIKHQVWTRANQAQFIEVHRRYGN